MKVATKDLIFLSPVWLVLPEEEVLGVFVTLSQGDTQCQHDQFKNQAMTNLPKTQPLVMGTLLSLPGLETPPQNAVARHVHGRYWSDSHRAAQESVRKEVWSKTSAIWHFKAISFLSFSLLGCSQHLCHRV